MNKIALVTGCTGQTGSFLAELLLEKGYKVLGLMRRVSTDTTERIQHIIDNKNFEIITGDITDASLMYSIINNYNPNEVYNLAAMSHVGISFQNPTSTFNIDALGCLNLLEAIRLCKSNTKFYQASTSEMFGSNYTKDNHEKYQDENTPFSPNSPYAIAKLAAHNMVRLYRDSYGIFAVSGILFNHESERRGLNFVTRKITRYVAALYNYLNVPSYNHTELQMMKEKMEVSNNTYNDIPKLRLGNINSYRDWGYAKDYVRAMWLMLQQNNPDDYVISSEETHSVEEFLKQSFLNANIYDYNKYIEIDKDLFRPNEVDYLCGKSTKAHNILGWYPEVSFTDLVNIMIGHDIYQLQAERKVHA